MTYLPKKDMPICRQLLPNGGFIRHFPHRVNPSFVHL